MEPDRPCETSRPAAGRASHDEFAPTHGYWLSETGKDAHWIEVFRCPERAPGDRTARSGSRPGCYSYFAGVTAAPRQVVLHPSAARLVFRSEHMDGTVLGLFLFATFVGGVVAGLAGFAMSLVVS